jgi:hypothetical protein
MPVSSPYAVFRAEDWAPLKPLPATTSPGARKRRAPALAKTAVPGSRWSTLVQGDLFQAQLELAPR